MCGGARARGKPAAIPAPRGCAATRCVLLGAGLLAGGVFPRDVRGPADCWEAKQGGVRCVLRQQGRAVVKSGARGHVPVPKPQQVSEVHSLWPVGVRA